MLLNNFLIVLKHSCYQYTHTKPVHMEFRQKLYQEQHPELANRPDVPDY